MKSLSVAIGLAAALAAAPALAGQKFCAPEGTLEIDQGAASFTPSDPADKAQVVVAKVETEFRPHFDCRDARRRRRSVHAGRARSLRGGLRFPPVEMAGLERVQLTAAPPPG